MGQNSLVDQDRVYQRIGEFVVCFQFIESQLRQVGWLLLDPGRKVWPPQELRKETSESLADKVASLYQQRLHLCNLPDQTDRLGEFQELITRFHELRRFRNRVLHSAYIEFKGGGEVMALIRSNSRFVKDIDTGEESVDQERLSDTLFQDEMAQMSDLAFRLGQHYLQLIARLPTY